MRPNESDLIAGKYRIVRMIGDGGMGAVYEARHEVLGVPVALKFLHGELARRPGLSSRFLQEARVSAHIQSPHVVRVSDVDTAPDGSPYLVMELLHGESLQAVLDREARLPSQKAVDFALQILAGLESAHAMNVVHRDLKPDNVFVTPGHGGSLLKLIDFGIAKLRATSEFQRGLTRAGVIMGTPEYMAPEQLFAADQVDLRADIYSMGVMLFEMLSGQRPSDGDDADQIIANVMSGRVKKLGDLVPELPPGLSSVVERATAPDRDARFPNAFEFRQALAGYGVDLSQAGRAAATLAQIAPMLTLASGSPPSSDFSPLSYARTSSAPPLSEGRAPPLSEGRVSNVERTMPPDDTEPAGPYSAGFPKGSTQRASNAEVQAVRQPTAKIPAQSPAPYYPSAPPPVAQRKGGGFGWLVALLLGVIVTSGSILGVMMYQRSQSGDEPTRAPDATPPVTSVGPLEGPIASPPGPAAPGPNAPVTDSRPTPVGPTPKPKTDAGVAKQDAGARPDGGGFIVIPIPSGLSIPSGFPTSLPPGFPSAFPPGFPQLPGINAPGPAKAAPGDGGK